MDAGAADVSLDPIDFSTAVTINAGDSADPLGDFIGATIEGRTGDSKRLAICYGTNGVGIWDNVLTGTETAVTGISNLAGHGSCYIGAMGGGKYAATSLYARLISLIDGTAESGTTTLPVFADYANDGAYTHPVFTRDLDTMAVLVQGVDSPYPPGTRATGIHIGTSMLTTPSWATLDISGSNAKYQVYNMKELLFDDEGNLWVAVQTDTGDVGTAVPFIIVIAPPYTSVTYTLTPSWSGGGSMNVPAPMVISRDGRYVASCVDVNQTIVDIWQVSTRTRIRTLSIPSGYTRALGYGGLCFGPDGRLFAHIYRDSDSMGCVAVWSTPASSNTHEIIPVSLLTYETQLTVSGDGQALVSSFNYDADPASMCIIEPPYTAAGATVSGLYNSYPMIYEMEFDPSESYAVATGLTLVASVTSATGSGNSITVVTRLTYANTSGVAAFGVIIEMAVPDGSTFVSATNGGLYDSEAGIVKWLIPSVAASATGYVECTMTTGA